MIYYSVDNCFRKYIIAIMAIIAVSLLHILEDHLPSFLLEFGSLSAFGIFGVFFLLFDQFLWKYLPFIKVPDMSGTWIGEVNRGEKIGKTEGTKSEVTVKITQTWTKIDVIFKGTHSISRPEIVGLFVNNYHHIELHYAYHKEPRDATKSDNQYSKGYTRLTFEKTEQGSTLVGRYFSDVFRGGSICLKRTC